MSEPGAPDPAADTVEAWSVVPRAREVHLTQDDGVEVGARVVDVSPPTLTVRTERAFTPPDGGATHVRFTLSHDATYVMHGVVAEQLGNRITLTVPAEARRVQMRGTSRRDERVVARIARNDGSTHWITAHVRDLSTAGAGVLVAEVLEPDEIVLFDATLGGGHLRCRARVARREAAGADDAFVRYGLEFELLTDVERALLARFTAP